MSLKFLSLLSEIIFNYNSKEPGCILNLGTNEQKKLMKNFKNINEKNKSDNPYLCYLMFFSNISENINSMAKNDIEDYINQSQFTCNSLKKTTFLELDLFLILKKQSELFKVLYCKENQIKIRQYFLLMKESNEIDINNKKLLTIANDKDCRNVDFKNLIEEEGCIEKNIRLKNKSFSLCEKTLKSEECEKYYFVQNLENSFIVKLDGEKYSVIKACTSNKKN